MCSAVLGADHLTVEGVSEVVCCLCNQPVTLLEELYWPQTAGIAFHFPALTDDV